MIDQPTKTTNPTSKKWLVITVVVGVITLLTASFFYLFKLDLDRSITKDRVRPDIMLKEAQLAEQPTAAIDDNNANQRYRIICYMADRPVLTDIATEVLIERYQVTWRRPDGRKGGSNGQCTYYPHDEPAAKSSDAASPPGTSTPSAPTPSITVPATTPATR